MKKNESNDLENVALWGRVEFIKIYQNKFQKARAKEEVSTRNIKIGSMTGSEIILLTKYLESIKVNFKFRIVDDFRQYSDTIFTSSQQYISFLERPKFKNIDFIYFICVVDSKIPMFIDWSPAKGKISINQQFPGELEKPGTNQDNKVEIIYNLFKENRESWWYRSSDQVYTIIIVLSLWSFVLYAHICQEQFLTIVSWSLIIVVGICLSYIQLLIKKREKNYYGLVYLRETTTVLLKKKNRSSILKYILGGAALTVFGVLCEKVISQILFGD